MICKDTASSIKLSEVFSSSLQAICTGTFCLFLEIPKFPIMQDICGLLSHNVEDKCVPFNFLYLFTYMINLPYGMLSRVWRVLYIWWVKFASKKKERIGGGKLFLTGRIPTLKQIYCLGAFQHSEFGNSIYIMLAKEQYPCVAIVIIFSLTANRWHLNYKSNNVFLVALPKLLYLNITVWLRKSRRKQEMHNFSWLKEL